jgi:hypothetical protein
MCIDTDFVRHRCFPARGGYRVFPLMFQEESVLLSIMVRALFDGVRCYPKETTAGKLRSGKHPQIAVWDFMGFAL